MKKTFTITIHDETPFNEKLAFFLNNLIDTDDNGITGHEHMKCPAFIYGGPGSQSRHTCEYTYPHTLEDEHGEINGRYQWSGTAVMDEVWNEKLNRNVTRLAFNPKNEADF